MDERDRSVKGFEVDRLGAWPRLLGLRHHWLVRFAIAYAVVAWLIVQVAATVGPAFELPSWFLRAVIVAAVMGFALILGGAAILTRRRQSGAAQGRQRRWLFGAALAGLIAAVGGIGFLAREAVLGDAQVTIAVLPFADLSPGRDKGFLAAGVAEEILGTLGRNTALKVLGQSSINALGRGPVDLAHLKSALDVTHVLEGSVRSSGNQLRMNVRLVRTADQKQLWADDYRADDDEIFALQERVAGAVAERLARGVDEPAARNQGSRRGSSSDADGYTLYLAARQVARTRTEPELKRAYALIQQSLAKDPGFAPSHALAGQLIWHLSDRDTAYGHLPLAVARPRALAAARRAIELSPNRAEGYGTLGLVQPAEQSIAPLRRAMALDPGWSEPRLWLALSLDSLGRHEEAIDALKQGLAIDPLWPAMASRLSLDLAFLGRAKEARAVIDRFERQGGAPAQVARFRVRVTRLHGDYSETVRFGRLAMRLDRDIPNVSGDVLRALAITGLPDQARLIRLPASQSLRTLHWTRGARAVSDYAEVAGEKASDGGDRAYLLFDLMAVRRFDRLIGYYVADVGGPKAACEQDIDEALPILVALGRAGDQADARALLDCLDRRLSSFQGRSTTFDPYALAAAQIAGLKGERAAALAKLDQAIGAGWFEYSARLRDYPAFDSLGDPALAVLQRRIDAHLAKERNEIIALR